ncbi:MAG: hypothetical protein ABS81_17645 [Pseudonocardia sp. SCN 72-86]|nr:MAG: hypothetical protein ABS81_17645 [Pseudonocardia sp. SCN 72-86]
MGPDDPVADADGVAEAVGLRPGADRGDPPGHLVAEDEGQGDREASFEVTGPHVHVGTADGRGLDVDDQRPGFGFGARERLDGEGGAVLGEDGCSGSRASPSIG